MNILFLNSLNKRKWGGGEKWMVVAAKGLADKGHHVTIACIKNSVIEQKAKERALKTWYYTIPADIAFWKVYPLKAFLKEADIDVLICCQNRDVKIGARAARAIGIKAIFARQGIQNLSNKKKYIRPFTQYIDGIITNTKSIKKIYESFGWFPDNFIHVIYNGIEIPKDVFKIKLHDEYQLPPGSKIIFSAGRLDFQKGFDLLIRVASIARDQDRNWQFIIAGEGKLKQELIRATVEKSVSDRVHFIGFSDKVSSLLKSSDAFVLPSRYEGMPNALLEAMANKKASVATSVNGAPELVEDGISGFLVESENTEQIFERLNRILTDDDLRFSMERGALERVKNHFTTEKMVQRLEDLFLEQMKKQEM
ncbi:MAG: glycosyltransferase family 4 protein [Cytophagales bacterium]|nr:glycosyltransferase family 4 protein [Cytophagales bacterium]